MARRLTDEERATKEQRLQALETEKPGLESDLALLKLVEKNEAENDELAEKIAALNVERE